VSVDDHNRERVDLDEAAEVHVVFANGGGDAGRMLFTHSNPTCR
jgi:hypothetical protein